MNIIGKLICGGLVVFVILYVVCGLTIGPVTSATWNTLPNEAEYTVVGIDKQLVTTGKTSHTEYALTVEYETPQGTQQYKSPSLYGENNIGDDGILRYSDDTVLLDREVSDNKGTTTSIIIGIAVIAILALFVGRNR